MFKMFTKGIVFLMAVLAIAMIGSSCVQPMASMAGDGEIAKIAPPTTPTPVPPGFHPTWSSTQSYFKDDIVEWEGYVYICLGKWWCLGEEPHPTNEWDQWEILNVIADPATPTVTPTPTATTTVYTITISYGEPVHGTVEMDPPGGSYAPGTVVTLTGVGYSNGTESVEFTGWEGNINSTLNPVTVTMNSSKFIVAHFSRTIKATPTPWPTFALSVNPTLKPYYSPGSEAIHISQGHTEIKVKFDVNNGHSSHAEGRTITFSGSRYPIEPETAVTDADGYVTVNYMIPADASISFSEVITASYTGEILKDSYNNSYMYSGSSIPVYLQVQSVIDYPAWGATEVYTAGARVSHNGANWEAKWWTTGEEPGTTGEWGVWQQL